MPGNAYNKYMELGNISFLNQPDANGTNTNLHANSIKAFTTKIVGKKWAQSSETFSKLRSSLNVTCWNIKLHNQDYEGR